MEYTVKDLAAQVQGRVIGAEEVILRDTRSLQEATKDTITFAVGDYVHYLDQCQAGAVIVEEPVEGAPMPLIVVDNAKMAFSVILSLFHPPVVIPKGVHPTALIGEGVTLGKDVAIGPYCVVQDHATIGDGVILYAHVYVGHYVQIGQDSVLYPHVVVHEHCVLGERVVLRANAIIGGEGFGFATENGKHTHIPQVGNVVLEDDVEIGSCSCVDNGTMGSTRVGRGTKIDNLVHLAHNVEIGEDCFLVAQVGIAGSTKCGHHCIFAGQSGSTGHVTIGDNCTFAARTGITGHVPDGVNYAGFPMRPHREWLKNEAYISKMPDLAKTVKGLVKEVQALSVEVARLQAQQGMGRASDSKGLGEEGGKKET